MASNFDPYYHWLGIAPDEQPANHYRLLGIRLFESEPTVIQNAADQRMTHLRTFQTGQHAQHSQRILSEIASASNCLLIPAKKSAYDQQLRASLQAVAMPQQPQLPQQPMYMQGPMQHPQGMPYPHQPMPLTPVPLQPVPYDPAPVAVESYLPPQAEEVATSAESAPVFSGARGGLRRSYRRKSPAVEFAKIALGGCIGMAFSLALLWYGLGVDPTGLFTRLSASTDDAVANAAPPNTPPNIAPNAPPPAPPAIPATPAPETPPTTPGNVIPAAPATETPAIPETPTVSTSPTSPKQFGLAAPPQGMDVSQLDPVRPIYLTDLTYNDFDAYETRPLEVVLEGRSSAHGIFLRPNPGTGAKIVYRLNRKFQMLSGAVGNADTAPGDAPSEFEMRIVGDGRTLWTSKPIQRQGESQWFQVEVTDIDELKLEVLNPEDNQEVHAVWFGVMATPNSEILNPELAQLFPEAGGATPNLADMLNPREPAAKKPLPDAIAIEAARKTLMEVIGSELKSAATVAAKTKLADKIYAMTETAGQTDASRLVILQAATENAVTVEQFFKAATELTTSFEGDFLDQKYSGLNGCKSQAMPTDATKLSEYIMATIEEAERAERFDIAAKLVEVGQSIGRKIGDRRLSETFVARSKYTEKVVGISKVCAPLFEQLKTDPDNPDASLKCGQYVALVRDDWAVALAMLSKAATSADLQAVVARDLTSPTDMQEMFSLADQWWDLAEKSSQLSKEIYRRRAIYWYRMAKENSLQGLELEKATKRIAESTVDWLAGWRPYSPEALLLKQMVGRYQLFLTNLGTNRRGQLPGYELREDHTIVASDGDVKGTWSLVDQALVLKLNELRSDLELQYNPRNKSWMGRQEGRFNFPAFGWELIPEMPK